MTVGMGGKRRNEFKAYEISNDSSSIGLKPHQRSIKSEESRTKRIKNFLSKQRLMILKRQYFNERKSEMERELAESSPNRNTTVTTAPHKPTNLPTLHYHQGEYTGFINTTANPLLISGDNLTHSTTGESIMLMDRQLTESTDLGLAG